MPAVKEPSRDAVGGVATRGANRPGFRARETGRAYRGLFPGRR